MADLPTYTEYGGIVRHAHGVVLLNPDGSPQGAGQPSTVTPYTAQQTSTTGAVSLPTKALANGAVVKALSTNTGTVYIGPAGVTAATGYPLLAGEAISFAVGNLNQLFIIGSDATQVVAIAGS